MKLKLFALALAASLMATSCANMSPTQQRTLSGAGIGTAAGVALGALRGGDLGWNAVYGAALGAAGGYIYDRHKQSERRAYEQGLRDGRATRKKRKK